MGRNMKKISILLFLAHSILFAQNTIPNQNDFSYEALDYYQQNNPNFHMTEISTWLWNWDASSVYCTGEPILCHW